MSKPPIAAKEIQISHNGTIFTIQVTLVEESTQVPPPSSQSVDTLKIVTVVTSAADGDNKGENMLMLMMKHDENMT